jgi:hypothetical protein
MQVPVTNAIIGGAPTSQAGIASALLNASREVAGLLGVTVIGAVLRSSEGAALRSGTQPGQAFIDGYHTGLWLTIGLLAAGVVLSYLTLRPSRSSAEAEPTLDQVRPADVRHAAEPGTPARLAAAGHQLQRPVPVPEQVE